MRCNLGEAHRAMQQFKRAIDQYEYAIRLQPALTIEKDLGLTGLALLRESIAAVAARHGAG